MGEDACDAALPRRVSVAIVGSGFSGIAVAIALKKAGVEDLILLERASTLGGTWRDNRYPGCACDVPAHLYSFSFAPNPDWSRTYAPQAEIRAYVERVADEFDVRRHVRFERDVRVATWDEAAGCWHLRTRGGEELFAESLVLATGALSNPAIPRLPGIERFRGARFHSARWDHDVDLRGKRVAVIGTGASAIQLVPEIQPLVSRLFLLQRTPAWVLPRHDRAYGRLEKAAFRAVPGARRLLRASIHWKQEAPALAFFRVPALLKVVEVMGRRHIARSIADPALRARLTPSYRAGCKRLLLSNDYYPALAQENVEVVGAAIAEVGERAISLADGRSLDVDAIIYGTGFAVHDHLGGIEVVGRDGADLAASWKRDGAEAFAGTSVAGFPNLFIMTGPNTGLGHSSMLIMIEAQARYVSDAIGVVRARGAAAIEPRAGAQAGYNAWLRSRMGRTIWTSGCKSWYLDERGRNTTLWPSFVGAFEKRTRFDLDDHELHPAPAPARARPIAKMLGRAAALAARGIGALPAWAQIGLSGGERVVLDGDALLPEVQLAIALRRRFGSPPLDRLSPVEARARFRRDVLLLHGERPEVARVRDLRIDGAAGKIAARHYVPIGPESRAMLVYYHGGGFVVGDLDTHDSLCRTLCREGGMQVLSIDYRLAPEHPFPAAVEDSCAAFRWAVRHADALGVDEARIAVGGDSAGGNLAAVVALETARDAGPRPAAQVLLYPAIDRSQAWRSLDRFAEGFLLSRADVDWFNHHYSAGSDPRDPRLAPIRASDLSDLPRALVFTAAFDPLRDEGEAYANTLRAAGNSVVLRRVAGQVHGFAHLGPLSCAARETVVEIARETRALLERTPAAQSRAAHRDSPKGALRS